MALPAYHLIERAFPGAERRLLTNFPVSGKAAAAAAILDNSGLVDGYMSYSAGTRNPLQLLAVWWKIVWWRPQVLVYLGSLRGLASARRDAQFFRICGIRKQVGVPLTPWMQTKRWDAATELAEPECVRLTRNLAELGDARLDQREAWDLRLTPAEQAKATQVLAAAQDRPLLAVSLGTKVPVNDWGRAKWLECLRRLGTLYPERALALIGAADEREACEDALAAWQQGAGPASIAINLSGLLTPRESAACLSRAQLFLGHDSGPLHLAAAVGTPCVGIFSARNLPGQWFPYGPHHRILYHRVSCMGCFLEQCTVEQKRCIASVTVDEVVQQVQAALEPLREQLGISV